MQEILNKKKQLLLNINEKKEEYVEIARNYHDQGYIVDKKYANYVLLEEDKKASQADVQTILWTVSITGTVACVALANCSWQLGANGLGWACMAVASVSLSFVSWKFVPKFFDSKYSSEINSAYQEYVEQKRCFKQIENKYNSVCGEIENLEGQLYDCEKNLSKKTKESEQTL